MTEADEHSAVSNAAVRLQELRARAVLIRDSRRMSEAQKEAARRALAAEMAQATARYRTLAEAAAMVPPAALRTPHGRYRRW
jgi:hypothetical protein